MIDPAFTVNHALAEELRKLVGESEGALSPFEIVASADAPRDPDLRVDVVVSLNEINDRHGTGPLIKRILQARQNVFSVRSRNDWGFQDFGQWHVCLPQEGNPRPECFRRVLGVLGHRKVRQVICVPFLPDELITSIAVKECYNARLCVYLMDDQNVYADGISNDLMAEFLSKCSLRLATHPELGAAYEMKFGLKFNILPAIVPDALVVAEPVIPMGMFEDPSRGALIGSFWDQSWFDRLCDALEGLHLRVDWYGNNKSPWFKFPPERLMRAGITAHGLVPERELAMKLREYPFVMVPVGNLDARETNRAVARLSLPGRILFVVATSHTPVLIIGNEQTCAARFVRHFQVGEVVPYSGKAIGHAARHLADPEVQCCYRRNAAKLARRFSDPGVSDWLEKSVELGYPADERFELIFEGYDTKQVLDGLKLHQMQSVSTATGTKT